MKVQQVFKYKILNKISYKCHVILHTKFTNKNSVSAIDKTSEYYSPLYTDTVISS